MDDGSSSQLVFELEKEFFELKDIITLLIENMLPNLDSIHT